MEKQKFYTSPELPYMDLPVPHAHTGYDQKKLNADNFYTSLFVGAFLYDVNFEGAGGQLSWQNGYIRYDDRTFTLLSGFTDKKYIYWSPTCTNTSFSGGSGNTFFVTDTEQDIRPNEDELLIGIFDKATNEFYQTRTGTAISNGFIYTEAIDARVIRADELTANKVIAIVNDNASAGTVINPGKILIYGGTTLDDWRHGSDFTMIDGGSLYTGSVTANKITTASLSAIQASLGVCSIDSSGYLRSGTTGYNSGDGFWLGYTGGKYKFYIGNSSSKLLYDGTNVTITGQITSSTVTGGTIRTSASGTRIEMSDTDAARLNWYYGTTRVGYINAGAVDKWTIASGGSSIATEYFSKEHRFYYSSASNILTLKVDGILCYQKLKANTNVDIGESGSRFGTLYTGYINASNNIEAGGRFDCNGSTGNSGTFKDQGGNTITVTGGIITSGV